MKLLRKNLIKVLQRFKQESDLNMIINKIYIKDTKLFDLKFLKVEKTEAKPRNILIERIIAAYYISDNNFYYLEKMDYHYVLTKRHYLNETKVLLSLEFRNIFDDDLSYKFFRNFCNDAEHKLRLFKTKEDINEN